MIDAFCFLLLAVDVQDIPCEVFYNAGLELTHSNSPKTKDLASMGGNTIDFYHFNVGPFLTRIADI
jgi:hypothetical protein